MKTRFLKIIICFCTIGLIGALYANPALSSEEVDTPAPIQVAQITLTLPISTFFTLPASTFFTLPVSTFFTVPFSTAPTTFFTLPLSTFFTVPSTFFTLPVSTFFTVPFSTAPTLPTTVPTLPTTPTTIPTMPTIPTTVPTMPTTVDGSTTTTTTITSPCSIDVVQTEVVRLLFVPFPRLITINGEGTDFKQFGTQVVFEAASPLSVIRLAKLVNAADQTIQQFVLILPAALLPNVPLNDPGETVTVSITGGGCDTATDTFEILGVTGRQQE